MSQAEGTDIIPAYMQWAWRAQGKYTPWSTQQVYGPKLAL